MKRSLSKLAVGVALMALTTWPRAASAQAVPGAEAREGRSFVLRAGRVLPVSPDLPWEIESGVIVVRDGRIVVVGSDVEIPPDLPVIDLPDATVLPGLVSAATSLAGQNKGDESVAAGYLAIDTYDAYADYGAILAGGVTTVHLNPGAHALVTGQGAVVKLGGPRSARVLRRRADLTINFGESAWNPPRHLIYPIPSSPDVPIEPAQRQRPDSRLGQYLALEEALAMAEPVEFADSQAVALLRAWREEIPLRVQAQRGADIAGTVRFMQQHDRKGYLVGAAEANLAAGDLVRANLPVVYRVATPLRGSAGNIGYDPDALEADLSALKALDGVKLALAGAAGQPTEDLRLAAATALRAGLSRRRVIEALTRVPAEILGVADRVGSLSPGHDADLAVFSGDPLETSSHVLRAYIGGALAFEAPDWGALVVRAGIIWIDEHTRIHDGAVLIEDGKITAVGTTVPHPPFARLIDAGVNGFVTPGLVDAFGHLGLDSDRAATGPALSPAKLVGVPDVTHARVARAGITTVMLSPYSASSQGSQVSAIKTGGVDRASRVVRGTAGVLFDFRASDPMDVSVKLHKRLEAGKKYLEKWQKYEKELAEWKEKQAKGETADGQPKTEEVQEVEGEADPITGTWEVTVSGGPIPEPMTASMQLRLTGSDIEGYLSVPGEAEEVKVVATLDGTHITGRLEVDTGGLGYPSLEADIVEEDHIVGVISFQGIDIDLEARRTDKNAVEFKVTKRRRRGKGGRPLPPKVEEPLEPLRAVLEKKIPLVIEVRTPASIAAALKIAKAFEVHLVLRDAQGAGALADKLVEEQVGVIVPTTIMRRRHDRWYHQADDLQRRGVSIAFQSDGEDSAKALPLTVLHAVERGLGADAALAAMTIEASRMYQLEDRVGSLAPGKDGDLVIFTGHPFEPGARVERVIINGREVQ